MEKQMTVEQARKIVKSEYPNAWLANPGTCSSDGRFYVLGQYDMSITLATGKNGPDAWRAAASKLTEE